MKKRRVWPARPVVIRDGVGYVELSRGYIAEIDEADAEFIGQWSWTASVRSDGYITAHITRDGKKVYMHRAIMGSPHARHVDHIDGNPLNNRRSNLRICTRSQNGQNRSRNKGKTLPKGVRLSRQGTYDTWIAFDGKRFYLGRYKTAEAAAAARFVAEKLLHGEYARHCLENLKKFFAEEQTHQIGG